MLLVEENGIPLSFGVDGANRHDSILLDLLLHDRFNHLNRFNTHSIYVWMPVFSAKMMWL